MKIHFPLQSLFKYFKALQQQKILLFCLFQTGHSCTLARCIKKSGLFCPSLLYAISYCNIRPWCFIYRVSHWQKVALHNEYTNAFSRAHLESCFYKMPSGCNIWMYCMLRVSRDNTIDVLCLAPNGFSPE